MSMQLKVDGFEGLEKALLQLPRAAARSTVMRALRKELKPVANAANGYWPGSNMDAFRIRSRVKRSQMRNSKADFAKTVVNMFVGAVEPHAHLLEFGTGPRVQKTTGRYTGAVMASPMLQPAWDANKSKMIDGLSRSIWAEIEKTLAKQAKKAG